MVMASRVPATIRSRSLSSSLRVRRHDDELAVDRGRRGRTPVGLRNGMCETCRAALAPIMAQDVGVVLPVGGQGRRHDLDFVEVAGREERADGPVDEPAR